MSAGGGRSGMPPDARTPVEAEKTGIDVQVVVGGDRVDDRTETAGLRLHFIDAAGHA